MHCRFKRAFLAALVAFLITACGPAATQDDGGTWVPEVVARYPHDPNAFTQGLIFRDGYLYESTGRRGQSSLRKVDVSTGRVEQFRPLAPEYFGEGLTEFDGRLIQITWESGVGFVYDLSDFSVLERFRYEGEGWGLTHDGDQLIMSDGTSTLRFLDPNDFSLVRQVDVTFEGMPVGNLNELEYIDGLVWANIWLEEVVARIDPASGEVRGWIDLSALYPAALRDSDAVVNGIAYDEANDRIIVTGKLWPAVFEISFDERR